VKVVVYVREADVRMLQRENTDPAEWVRSLVRYALDKRASKHKETHD
jgi:hypothetical protein